MPFNRISIDKTFLETVMVKKRSLICILLVLTVILGICFTGSCHASKNADTSFEQFSNELFCHEVSSNSITLHYTLSNPSEYGINTPAITFGSFPVSSAESCAYTENCLELLHKIPYRQLNKDNQLTYRILEASLNESLEGADYLLYEEPLSPLTGIQAQLPVLLSEYQFYTLSDADAYLKLLETVPEYFNSLIEFERSKADASLFMASYLVDALINECTSFLEMGNSNYLYSSFESRLASLEDCGSTERADYIAQNKKALEDCVFPAYRNLISALTELRDSGKNQKGLCYLPDGKAFYQYLACRETGSDRSIKDLKQLTLSQMQTDLRAMQSILNSPKYTVTVTNNQTADSTDSIFPEFTLEDSNPASILRILEEKLEGLFPKPPEVNTEIKFVQPEMEEFLSPAFYMVPAIDNAHQNTIYINPGHLPDDLNLFTTLAHEGYPGHLYQNTYYAATNPSPLRNLLGCGGYTEGWATYTEMISYYFTGLPKEQASLLQHNASLLLGLYSLADIGIHYEGWSLTETITFFQQYGITDSGTIERIYDLIIGDPANYLKYYIGYVEFLELKKDAAKAWGDEFSQLRFHEAVLNAGPAPFPILKDAVL